MKSRIHSLPRLPAPSSVAPLINRQHVRLQFPQRGDQFYFENSGKKLFQLKNHSVIDSYLKSSQTQNQSQLLQKRMRKHVQSQNPRAQLLIDLMPTQPKKINKKTQKAKSLQINQKDSQILNKNKMKMNGKKLRKEIPSDILDQLIQSRSQNKKQLKVAQKLKPLELKDQIIIKDFRQKIDPNCPNPQMQANRSNLYAIFEASQGLPHKIQANAFPIPISNKSQTRQHLNSKRSDPTSLNSYSQSPYIQSYKSNSYLRLFGSPENLYDQFSKYRYEQVPQQAVKINYKNFDLKNGTQNKQIGGYSSVLRRGNPSNLITLSYI